MSSAATPSSAHVRSSAFPKRIPRSYIKFLSVLMALGTKTWTIRWNQFPKLVSDIVVEVLFVRVVFWTPSFVLGLGKLSSRWARGQMYFPDRTNGEDMPPHRALQKTTRTDQESGLTVPFPDCWKFTRIVKTYVYFKCMISIPSLQNQQMEYRPVHY